MARSSYIYLVHPTGRNDIILAVFTVKYESQIWAEQSEQSIENLERSRMRDGGDSNSISSRVAAPWE